MAKPKRVEISCPDCGHTQMEYAEANSTFCHACGHRIVLNDRSTQRKARKAPSRKSVARRTLPCCHCQHPLDIPEESESWQCPVCSGYLDLKDHTITTTVGRSILTYGDILVENRGSFGGNRIEGGTITLAGGLISGQMLARQTFQITRPSRLNAEVSCDTWVMDSGSEVDNRKTVSCQSARISGKAKLRELKVSGTLHILGSGSIDVQQLVATHINVEPGGRLKAAQVTSQRRIA